MENIDKDSQLFGRKSFSDLMNDIYNNSRKKDKQINRLIEALEPLVENVNDANYIVPLIKEYLDVSIKNDEHLVKLAGIVQRFMATANKVSVADGGLGALTADEIEALQSEINEEFGEIENELKEEVKSVNSEDVDKLDVEYIKELKNEDQI